MAVVKSPGDRQRVAECLNRDLVAVSERCRRWNMKLNPAKTKIMIVSRSRTVEPVHSALHVDNVDELDKELTFNAHVRDLASRASCNVGIVRRVARVFQDHSIFLTCVRSFVLPLFEYCSPV